MVNDTNFLLMQAIQSHRLTTDILDLELRLRQVYQDVFTEHREKGESLDRSDKLTKLDPRYQDLERAIANVRVNRDTGLALVSLHKAAMYGASAGDGLPMALAALLAPYWWACAVEKRGELLAQAFELLESMQEMAGQRAEAYEAQQAAAAGEGAPNVH